MKSIKTSIFSYQTKDEFDFAKLWNHTVFDISNPDAVTVTLTVHRRSLSLTYSRQMLRMINFDDVITQDLIFGIRRACLMHEFMYKTPVYLDIVGQMHAKNLTDRICAEYEQL